MRLLSVVLCGIAIVIGCVVSYSRVFQVGPHEIYKDTHGDEWTVPQFDWLADGVIWVISATPRVTMKFKLLSPDFDLESKEYIEGVMMYVYMTTLLGGLLFIGVALFFLFRYACGCCGGNAIPRRGYSQSMVACVRLTLTCLSFLFEGVVIYGFFSNLDVDKSLTTLIDSYAAAGENLKLESDDLLNSWPEEGTPMGDFFSGKSAEIKTDIEFSARYATQHVEMAKTLMKKVEQGRMAIVMISLLLATVGCGIGIAAGSVSRGCPVKVMVILNTIACTVFFISFGGHFAAAKILGDYCDEVAFYIGEGKSYVVPTRLQFFLPCLASPVLIYLEDYYVYKAVTDIGEFQKELNTWVASYTFETTEVRDTIEDSVPYWFNITDSFYSDYVAASESDGLKDAYNVASDSSRLLQVLESNKQCEASRKEMEDENFLMCTYLKYHLNMTVMVQAFAAFITALILFTGIPAIRKFEWAGMRNRSTGAQTQHARAKRTPGG